MRVIFGTTTEKLVNTRSILENGRNAGVFRGTAYPADIG
jgi:hypothetical protein